MKKYKNGIIVGRFSPIHIGHEYLIDKALSQCEKVLIIISCNKLRDRNNPYTYEYRKKLIEKIYNKEILDFRISIAKIENRLCVDSSYGKEILKVSQEKLDVKPDLIVYGSDKDIFKCFDKEDIYDIEQLKIDRSLVKVSASKIRDALISKDYTYVKKYINPHIYNELETLEKEYNKYF